MHAITVTDPNGEVSVLDPGGFGTMTITKPIRIVADGNEGGVITEGGSAIIVNAGPNDVVSLRGLTIEGTGAGLAGIRFLAGGALHVEDCSISGFRGGDGFGIDVSAAGPSRLVISDSTIADNLSGVVVRPAGGAPASVLLDDVIVKGHSGAGIRVDGAAAVVHVTGSVVTQNGTGLEALNGGEILSFKDNAIVGNGVDGKPTGKTKLR